MQFQTIGIDFHGGIDTKTDPKAVLPAKLLKLVNGELHQPGSIRKRNGYRKLPDPSSVLSKVKGLAVHKNELLHFDGNTCRSFTGHGWTSKGTAYSLGLSARVFGLAPDSVAMSGSLDMVDAGRVGDYLIIAHNESNGARASVIHNPTGALISTTIMGDTNDTHPRVVVIGENVCVVYADFSDNDISMRVLDTNDVDAGWGAEIDIVTDMANAQAYNAAPMKDGKHGILVYESAAGNTEIVKFDVAGTSVATAQLNAGTGLDNRVPGIVVTSKSNNVHIGYHNGTAITSAAYNSALSATLYTEVNVDSVLGGTSVIMGCETANDDEVRFFYDDRSPSSVDQNSLIGTWVATASSARASFNASLVKSLCLVGGPFRNKNGDIFAMAAHLTTLGGTGALSAVERNTYFLIDSSGVAASRFADSEAYNGITVHGAMDWYSQAVDLGGDRWGIAAIRVPPNSEISNGAQRSQEVSVLYEFDFQNTPAHQFAEFGESIYITGGTLYLYDGREIAEAGFHVAPTGVTVAQGAAGTKNAGDYIGQCLYAFVDASGDIHLGAPSALVTTTVTGASDDQLTYTLPYCRITQKAKYLPELRLYESEKNKTAPKRHATVLGNVTTSDSNTLILGSEIAAASTKIYTDGGVADNDPPEHCSSIIVRGGRLFIYSPTKKTVFFSKRKLHGYGAEFSAGLFVHLPGGSAECLLAEQDGKVICLKRESVSYLDGEGPNSALGGAPLIGPIEISSDVGAREHSPVAQVDEGTVFVSQRGPELLDRSLSLRYIGAGVEAFKGLRFTSIVKDPVKHQLRFGTSDGEMLVYDYIKNEWSTFSGLESEAGVLWQGRHTIAKPNGQVWVETPGEFTDNGLPYPLEIGTSWIKLKGIQGYQRVRRLGFIGDKRSDHEMVVRAYFNYDETDYEELVLEETKKMKASDLYHFRWRIPVSRQDCMAVRFDFFDRDQKGTAESFSLSNFSLEVGIKSGLGRVPQNREN